MTQTVKGKTRAEAERMFDSFHGLVTGQGGGEELGTLQAFSGVALSAAVKCATLAWHAMRSALARRGVSVRTGFERVTDDMLARELRAANRDGTPICVGNADGPFAVRDECPHSGFPLSNGTLLPAAASECGWHGAQFDCRTGAVLEGPADDPLIDMT